MQTPLDALVTQTFRLASEQELLDAGYKRFVDHVGHHYADGAFQKKLRPGLYCNIYSYDFAGKIPGRVGQTFEAEAQLRNNRKCYNVQLLHDDESLEEVEAFMIAQAEWFEARYGPLHNDDD